MKLSAYSLMFLCALSSCEGHSQAPADTPFTQKIVNSKLYIEGSHCSGDYFSFDGENIYHMQHGELTIYGTKPILSEEKSEVFVDFDAGQLNMQWTMGRSANANVITLKTQKLLTSLSQDALNYMKSRGITIEQLNVDLGIDLEICGA